MKMNKTYGWNGSAAFLFLLSSLFLSGNLSAAETSYDPYTRVLPNKPQSEQIHKQSLLEKSLGVFSLPLDMTRQGLDRGLIFLERHRVVDKTKWVYTELTDRGIYPSLVNNPANFGQGSGLGLKIDPVKALGQKENLPYLRTRAGVTWANSSFFQFNSEIGIDKVQEIGPYGGLVYVFESRPNENFYGIGPDTTEADGTNFRSSKHELGLRSGYSLTRTVDAKVDVTYQDIEISNGDDGGRGNMFNYFPDGSIPGIDGGQLAIFGAGLQHDNRDYPEDAHKGGEQTFNLSFRRDVGTDHFGYFKYRGQISQFHEVFSERQVIGVRLVGEHNDETNGKGIPFYDMARLGGYGNWPALGDTQRGFESNRFFGESLFLINIEFRYLVWQYRDFSMDAVVFFDEGQVFDEFSNFHTNDFRESYGGGFRFKVLRKTLLSLEVAKSEEGARFYARSKTPF